MLFLFCKKVLFHWGFGSLYNFILYRFSLNQLIDLIVKLNRVLTMIFVWDGLVYQILCQGLPLALEVLYSAAKSHFALLEVLRLVLKALDRHQVHPRFYRVNQFWSFPDESVLPWLQICPWVQHHRSQVRWISSWLFQKLVRSFDSPGNFPINRVFKRSGVKGLQRCAWFQLLL